MRRHPAPQRPGLGQQSVWDFPRPPAVVHSSEHDRVEFASSRVYPQRVDRITVDGRTVGSVAGDFYGGWVTPWVTGPFKGGPGTDGW